MRSARPVSWDDANVWTENANAGRESYEAPTWRYCGFKLDFNGPIVRASSRFYPEPEGDMIKWSGDVSFMVLDKDVGEKAFKCESLDQLRTEVEAYVDEQTRQIHERISAMFKESQ